MSTDFTNFDKWKDETTQFIRETSGFPKPLTSPLQLKNQKLAELIQQVSDNPEIDSAKLISSLTHILLIGQ